MKWMILRNAMQDDRRAIKWVPILLESTKTSILASQTAFKQFDTLRPNSTKTF